MKSQKTMKVGFWSAVATGCILLSGAAMAEDQGFKLGSFDLTGGAKLGFLGVNGNRQSAKFNEYRSLSTGLTFDGDLMARDDAYYTGVTIFDAGRGDQKYQLSGGRFETFKYKLFYNQIIHNLSFNDSTFYTGVGTGTLDYTPGSITGTGTTGNGPYKSLAGWANGFDYSITRKQFGGDVSVSMLSPFYVDFGVSQEVKTGLRPLGMISGFELPAPVDGNTTQVYAEAAYRKDSIAASVRYDLSSYKTDNAYLHYRNPSLATTKVVANLDGAGDILSLSIPSTSNRLGVQGAIGDLPLHSSFDVRGGVTWLKDSLTLEAMPTSCSKSGSGSSTKTTCTTYDSGQNFEGKVGYSSFDTSLVSRPIDNLDTRLFFDYLNKHNTSSTFDFNKNAVLWTGATPTGAGTVQTPVTYETEVFNYHKFNGGLEAGYRLPFKTKVRAGYDHLTVVRDRIDALTTNDNHYVAKLSNDYLDWMGFKFKADYLARASDFEGASIENGGTTAASIADDATIHGNNRPFDAADKRRWKVTTGLDFSDLIESLDFGVEYSWTSNKYLANSFGRAWDQTNEAFFNAGYSFNKIRVGAFFDVEGNVINSNHYYATDHAQWQNSFNYRDWGYGFNVLVPLLSDQLDLVASWTQNVSKGSEAFATQFAAATPALSDLTSLENARHSIADIHATYHVLSRLSATVGFMFDQQTYQDDQWDGYVLNPSVGTSYYFLTGAMADKSYTAQVYYVSATYRL